jgi:hypothetical protein
VVEHVLNCSKELADHIHTGFNVPKIQVRKAFTCVDQKVCVMGLMKVMKKLGNGTLFHGF